MITGAATPPETPGNDTGDWFSGCVHGMFAQLMKPK